MAYSCTNTRMVKLFCFSSILALKCHIHHLSSCILCGHMLDTWLGMNSRMLTSSLLLLSMFFIGTVKVRDVVEVQSIG